MNYGRDYGNRNFLERAAQTVRGWVGRRGGGDDRFYDDEYRGGMASRGWDDDRGYREMGDVGVGYGGGFDRGYGATNWRGRNEDWNRGANDRWDRGMAGGGWGRGGGYRADGGYNARHGGWDVDWDENRSGGYGMDRGPSRGGMDRGAMGGYGWDDRDHYMGRDFQTNHPHFGHHWQAGHHDDDTVDMNRGGGWNRMGGGMTGRGMQGGMNRGLDRDRDADRGDWSRDRTAGIDRGYGAMRGDADLGDETGGTIGNYGAYGDYGIGRFRSGSGGGVPSGQHFRGYGVGSGYRP